MIRRILAFVTLVLVAAGCRGALVVSPHPARPVAAVAKVTKPAPEPLAPGPAVAQREAVLHLDELDGPEIGRAFAGARLRIVRVEGSAAEVALTPFERPVRGEGATQVPLTAWVELAALGTREIPLVEPPPAGRAARDHYTRVSASPGELGFFYTQCGALQLLEQGPNATRVAQRAGGVELVGWSETPIRGSRGDFRCPPRIVEGGMIGGAPPVPPGYAAARSVDVAHVLRAGQTVYWLVENEDGGYACEDWRVTKSDLRHTGHYKGERYDVDYTVEREGDRVLLLGPTTRTPTSESSLGCGEDYRAVDLDGDRLVLVPDAGMRPIAAYHPDDTEVWYLTAAACRAEAARATAPSAPALVAWVAPVHVGC